MIIKYIYNEEERIGRVFQEEGKSCENLSKSQTSFVGHMKSGLYPYQNL